MINLNADIDVFFDDFGIQVPYVHGTATPVSITVIFDDVSKISDVGVSVATKTPSVQCKLNEVPNLTVGDRFTINGKIYKAVEPIKDDYGIKTVSLFCIGTAS